MNSLDQIIISQTKLLNQSKDLYLYLLEKKKLDLLGDMMFQELLRKGEAELNKNTNALARFYKVEEMTAMLKRKGILPHDL